MALAHIIQQLVVPVPPFLTLTPSHIIVCHDALCIFGRLSGATNGRRRR
jgi:hypothetical protein